MSPDPPPDRLALELEACIAERSGASPPDLSYYSVRTRFAALIGEKDRAEARCQQLEAALKQARQVLVVACGEKAPYIRIALSSLDAALASPGGPTP